MKADKIVSLLLMIFSVLIFALFLTWGTWYFSALEIGWAMGIYFFVLVTFSAGFFTYFFPYEKPKNTTNPKVKEKINELVIGLNRISNQSSTSPNRTKPLE
jgi:hypothetical protein